MGMGIRENQEAENSCLLEIVSRTYPSFKGILAEPHKPLKLRTFKGEGFSFSKKISFSKKMKLLLQALMPFPFKQSINSTAKVWTPHSSLSSLMEQAMRGPVVQTYS